MLIRGETFRTAGAGMLSIHTHPYIPTYVWANAWPSTRLLDATAAI